MKIKRIDKLYCSISYRTNYAVIISEILWHLFFDNHITLDFLELFINKSFLPANTVSPITITLL